MAKRKKKQRNRSDTAPKPPFAEPSPREKRTAARSARPWLLGATTALLVAGPLVPGEASAAQGHGLLLVMLWIALAVVWLLAWLGRDRWEIRFGRLDVAVLVLIGLHTLAALWATSHAAPRPAINMLWHWVAFGLCFFMARQLVADAREARALAAVMIALAVTLAAYGIYQAAYELPQTRARYDADPDGMLRDADMWYPPGSSERLLFDKRLQSREPLASFALTNSLAGFLTPWLIVLAGAVVAIASRAMRGRACAIVAGCGLPVIVCLLLTKSRAAYAAVAVGAFLLWWMSRKRGYRIGWKIPTAFGAGVVILVGAVAATGALDRQVFSEASKSLGVRGQYWRASLDLIGDHFWLGCGPGNFQDTYTAYKLPTASEEIADPHNFLLETWATAGTPAALALLAVLACFASVVIRGTRAAPPTQETKPQPTSVPHVLGGAVLGLLLAFAVGVLAEMPPSPVVLLAGISLGTGCVWLLWPWLRRGSFPAFVPAVAVLALLVNLAAAGGIGFPSIAGTFWLLLAMGANLAQGKTDRRQLPGWTTYLALAVAMTLVLACYASAYRPVLE
ncbi:MAG: O-antigen ligase family protein, partial [Planctomycetes bacterium]|nr:O-antigen ligase family protein [Planctomycetota bacterium]